MTRLLPWKKVKKGERAPEAPPKISRRRRKLEAYDLGQRFSVEERLCKDVFQLEENLTSKIEEALTGEDYGSVGKYLKEFYLRICELIDEAKSEIVKTSP
jgi:hypothetical protein